MTFPFDHLPMMRALELAALGGAATRPNPLVGCVITDQLSGNIVAEGWHQYYGGPHAEVNAIEAMPAGIDLGHCRIFVTLEPCAHVGKTPPCADLLIHRGATQVVVATQDPNPLVAGQGIEKLRATGCRVDVGLLADEASWLNRRFLSMHQRRRPWVILKWAESADGRLAGANHGPVAITSELTRRLVHRWRTEEAAILVGATTARVDNPRLDSRYWPGPSPVRIVLTGRSPLPASLHLFDPGTPPTLLYGQMPVLDVNATFVRVPSSDEALSFLISDLYQRGLQSVLVEGGAAVLHSFIQADLWDEIRVLRNPSLHLPGGVAAPTVPSQAVLSALYPLASDEVREYRRTRL